MAVVNRQSTNVLRGIKKALSTQYLEAMGPCTVVALGHGGSWPVVPKLTVGQRPIMQHRAVRRELHTCRTPLHQQALVHSTRQHTGVRYLSEQQQRA